MKTIEFEKFKKGWTKRLESIFWDRFQKKQEELTMIYMFDFCSLNSDVRSDEFGHLFLCYNYEKRKESENNIILKNIFVKLFDKNTNDKYLGYYKLKSEDDFREVLMAFFLIGNEIEDIELKNYLLQNNVRKHYEQFQKTGLDSDELLEKYINDIIAEFQIVALRTKNVIFENENLLNNAKKFWNLPFIKHCEE
ncbi:hypothetical protein [Chryseobacterium sp. RR2-3-20]|uniref:hypothetical protein n=1 Tax=Chryseobacterium sp. RR2-3-20 TaxID=2787626 RepID=UPI001ADFCA83|nr:hypothetical protein [Chryseobacterium sp. RR2-3-20]